MTPPPPPPIATNHPHPPTNVSLHAVTDTNAIALPNPVLSTEGILSKRKLQKPLKAGVAATTSSDEFKTPRPDRPKAKRWDHKISVEYAARKPSSLKAAAKFLANEGLISLGGGLPSSEYFPFEKIEAKVPALGQFSEEETKQTGETISIGKHDIKEGKSAYDLTVALNYGQGTGSAQMIRWVTEHTELVHDPPYQDWQCVLGIGSSFSLEQCYRMFTERGDYVLYEEFTFSSAVETGRPLGLKPVGIKVDSEGLIPEVMDEILSNWDEKERGARKPNMLYTIPSGQNPTGATQSLERRRAVYAVAQKHDIIIVEDEPYYFLQMQPYTGPDAPAPPLPKNTDEFLKTLVPSLLSLDTDGRVVRLDSFSKVVAPGSRAGWVVASEQICEKFTRHNEASIQSTAGTSQAILHRLLDEKWGHEGYLQWLIFIRKEYTRRRNAILASLEKHLPKSVSSWNPPMAGMFLWIQIHPPSTYTQSDYPALEERIFHTAVENKVLLMPGSWFFSEGKGKLAEEGTNMFFRATYAAAEEEAMDTAVQRFGEALRKVFGVED